MNDLPALDACVPLARELIDPLVARERMIAAAKPLVGRQHCPLACAQGRVLAEDVHARLDMPGVDNSAMDGYALRLADLASSETSRQGLPVTQRIVAGAGVTRLAEESCARIFTGAPVPVGADCVVPQERARLDERGRMHVIGDARPGANIRYRGEESREGSLLLAAGTPLTPAALALMASQGFDEVVVGTRLTVALVSTGDELLEPGMAYSPGAVYNSNRVMLAALLEQQGCTLLDLGIIADTPGALHEAFVIGRDAADLVICTGGVSVGEEDHVRPVLDALGHVDFHGLAMKPGKPFTFGHLGSTPLVGLPGNPVAALVCWQLLALPFVHASQGRVPAALQHFPVPAGFSHRASRGRKELLRVVLAWGHGGPVARLAGGQGSNMLGAASQAHGYLMVAADEGVEEGRDYAFLPAAQFAV